MSKLDNILAKKNFLNVFVYRKKIAQKLYNYFRLFLPHIE